MAAPNNPLGEPPLSPWRRGRRGSPPPRVGPLIAVATAIGLIVLVGSLGLGTPPGPEEVVVTEPPSLASGDAQVTTTTTTTTTLPPTLSAMAPLDSPLLVIPSETDTLLWIWHPSAREAQWVPLPQAPFQARFDATGTWISYLAPTEFWYDLWVGLASGTQSVQWSGVTSARWHDQNAHTIAWTSSGQGGDDVFAVRVGAVDERTGVLIESVVAFPVSEDQCLAAWGDWGFATENCFENEIGLSVYDERGTLVTSAPWTLIDASTNGYLLVRDDTGAIVVVDTHLDPITTVPADEGSDLAITKAGDQVIEVSPGSDRTRVRSFFTGRLGGWSVSVNGAGQLLTLSDGQEFAVLHSADTGELVLVNWAAGATFRIPGNWPYVAAAWVP